MKRSRRTLSVHIEAPVERVFDYFKDPANWQELSPDVVFEDTAVTDDGVGTTYRWVAKIAGISVSGSDTFVEFTPNVRIVDRSSRSFEGTWTYSFEPEGAGTRLTLSSESRSFWRLPPLSWLLSWSAAKSNGQILDAAKVLLEERNHGASASTTPGP